ncbi:MAG: IS110 family transposase [Deinococcales bacterium]|nr:IS110 family transposase [Chitinophagaceae bacterium]
MKEYKQFFGVDISKKTIDVTMLQNNQNVHKQFSNDESGMQQLLSWVQELKVKTDETLFCMEATGLYCFTLTQFLVNNAIDTWIEHAAQIKKATALARGKNDKVDSLRIATYASKNLERLRLWKPMNSALEKIKHLATLRDRIVETQKRLIVPIKEFEDVGNVEMAKILTKTIKKSIAALDADLRNIEKQILKILNEDVVLARKYTNATSVVGIGFVTAINLMVHTNGFTQMTDVRKLACYCGVAPFEYTSGSSIRGKTKVHFMANKKLKCNLHMASLTAIKFDIDIKKYYERKCADGKNKMSVLNAVRNKLLARVLSCVNNDRVYVNKVA